MILFWSVGTGRWSSTMAIRMLQRRWQLTVPDVDASPAWASAPTSEDGDIEAPKMGTEVWVETTAIPPIPGGWHRLTVPFGPAFDEARRYPLRTRLLGSLRHGLAGGGVATTHRRRRDGQSSGDAECVDQVNGRGRGVGVACGHGVGSGVGDSLDASQERDVRAA